MKSFLTSVQLFVLSHLAVVIIKVLRATWRVRVNYQCELPRQQRVVFCFWHGKQAGLFAFAHSRPIAVLSSLSKDGELQARILDKLGYVLCRGSSSRGGVAGLKAMIRTIKGTLVAGQNTGCDAAFAVDGPRGPLRKVKPGAIEAAEKSGALIVPIAANSSRAWIFEKAWDKYALPKPFAQIAINVGAPALPCDLSAAELGFQITQLENLQPELV